MCKCLGNKTCLICWGAMEAAFDKKYQEMKAEGLEDYLEAKEFMWDFFAERDKENVDDATEESDPTQWNY
jgi:hypothetical protein